MASRGVPWCGRRDRRARGGEPPGAVDRRVLHPGSHPRRGHPAVLDRRHRRARRRNRTTRGSWRSPAPTSPPTAGARPSTRSHPASWTDPTWRASWCPGDRRRRPTCSNALDQRLQEGTLDPSAIAPIARLMSVGLGRLPRRPPDRPLRPRPRRCHLAAPHRRPCLRGSVTRPGTGPASARRCG